jgi:hypothetical protein
MRPRPRVGPESGGHLAPTSHRRGGLASPESGLRGEAGPKRRADTSMPLRGSKATGRRGRTARRPDGSVAPCRRVEAALGGGIAASASAARLRVPRSPGRRVAGSPRGVVSGERGLAGSAGRALRLARERPRHVGRSARRRGDMGRRSQVAGSPGRALATALPGRFLGAKLHDPLALPGQGLGSLRRGRLRRGRGRGLVKPVTPRMQA